MQIPAESNNPGFHVKTQRCTLSQSLLNWAPSRGNVLTFLNFTISPNFSQLFAFRYQNSDLYGLISSWLWFLMDSIVCSIKIAFENSPWKCRNFRVLRECISHRVHHVTWELRIDSLLLFPILESCCPFLEYSYYNSRKCTDYQMQIPGHRNSSWTCDGSHGL